jgi:hypothetical protein
MVGALPPLHDIARNAGVKLPDFLGTSDAEVPPTSDPKPEPKKPSAKKSESPSVPPDSF